MIFVGRNPILRATAMARAASNFAFAIASAVTFIFFARTLDCPATAIGLILAAGSIAAMLAAAATPRLSRRCGSARIIWLAWPSPGRSISSAHWPSPVGRPSWW